MNARAPRNWLLISLALNVLLLGGLAGGAALWWREGRDVATMPQTQARGLRQAIDVLPDAQRRNLAADLRAARRDNRILVQGSREARGDVLRLLREEPLDVGAVEAALQRARDADFQVRARVESTVVDFAATLTPAQRAALADGLSQQEALRVRRLDASAPARVP